MQRTYFKHQNGYSAKLYGKSSMVIFDEDGNQVSHTGSRNVNTEAEVMALLEGYPDLRKKLRENLSDIMNSNESEMI